MLDRDIGDYPEGKAATDVRPFNRWTTLEWALCRINMAGLIKMDAQRANIIEKCQDFDV